MFIFIIIHNGWSLAWIFMRVNSQTQFCFYFQVAPLCTGRAGAYVVHVPHSWQKPRWSLASLKKWPSGFFHRRKSKMNASSTWVWLDEWKDIFKSTNQWFMSGLEFSQNCQTEWGALWENCLTRMSIWCPHRPWSDRMNVGLTGWMKRHLVKSSSHWFFVRPRIQVKTA